ncbi:MAG TPA: hypothetical protein VLL25_08315 [Acidimicrobiales bacterium]|nr:hypothetical protein [Acidimicrobiales bacterium]
MSLRGCARLLLCLSRPLVTGFGQTVVEPTITVPGGKWRELADGYRFDFARWPLAEGEVTPSLFARVTPHRPPLGKGAVSEAADHIRDVLKRRAALRAWIKRPVTDAHLILREAPRLLHPG